MGVFSSLNKGQKWGLGGAALLFLGGGAAIVLSYVDYPIVALRSEQVVRDYKALGLPWVAEDVYPAVPADDNASAEFLAEVSSGSHG